jgi:hypothetical protein
MTEIEAVPSPVIEEIHEIEVSTHFNLQIGANNTILSSGET